EGRLQEITLPRIGRDRCALRYPRNSNRHDHVRFGRYPSGRCSRSTSETVVTARNVLFAAAGSGPAVFYCASDSPGAVSPNTSAVNASIVAPYFQASIGSPALAQACARNDSRSRFHCFATWGRSNPRRLNCEIISPCFPISTSSALIGNIGESTLISICNSPASTSFTGLNRGSSVAAAAAVSNTV